MKFVIQCVQHAKVSVDGNTVGSIGRGYLVLLPLRDIKLLT